MITTIDWNAIGAIIGGIGVFVALVAIFIQVKLNGREVSTVKQKVTTPSTVTGTIGEEVALIANRNVLHQKEDDRRIAQIWKEIGKEEPA